MKLYHTLIAVIIFLALAIGTFFAYKNYYPNLISPDQTDSVTVNSQSNGVYFQSGMNYYIADASNSLDRLGSSGLKQLPTNFDPIALSQAPTSSLSLEQLPISEKIRQSIKTDSGIYFIGTNLSFYNSKTGKTIDLVSTPANYVVSDFSLSPSGQLLAIDLLNTTTGDNNIEICDSTGSNLLQITSDGQSYFPVFSPDSTQIAFWQKGDAIYKINIDKTGKTKIINYIGIINKIFAWR